MSETMDRGKERCKNDYRQQGVKIWHKITWAGRIMYSADIFAFSNFCLELKG